MTDKVIEVIVCDVMAPQVWKQGKPKEVKLQDFVVSFSSGTLIPRERQC